METIRLTQPQNGIPLELLSRQAMSEERVRSNDSLGSIGPRYYRHSQGGFELFPSPGEGGVTLELEYFSRIPALGVDTGNGIVVTNWLSDLSPDVYLYGAAMHTAPFLQDDPRLATWGDLYGKAAATVNKMGMKAEMSGSGITMRKRGMVQSRANRNGTR